MVPGIRSALIFILFVWGPHSHAQRGWPQLTHQSVGEAEAVSGCGQEFAKLVDRAINDLQRRRGSWADLISSLQRLYPTFVNCYNSSGGRAAYGGTPSPYHVLCLGRRFEDAVGPKSSYCPSYVEQIQDRFNQPRQENQVLRGPDNPRYHVDRGPRPLPLRRSPPPPVDTAGCLLAGGGSGCAGVVDDDDD